TKHLVAPRAAHQEANGDPADTARIDKVSLMLRPLFPCLAIVALTACGSSTPAPGSAGDAGPSSGDASSAGDDAATGDDGAPIGSDAGGDAAIDAASGARVRVMAANTTS